MATPLINGSYFSQNDETFVNCGYHSNVFLNKDAADILRIRSETLSP